MKTFFLFLLGFAPTAWGLTTAYVSFEHPEGWRCELSQGVWICQSGIEADRKESVILSIATMATEWDTLDNYENYLKQVRTIQDEGGNPLQSKVTYTRKRNINGVNWIDSLQFNSELPGFWARYVATVQNKLAILITYIVSEEKYQQMAPQFERMIGSLKPNAEFNLNIASSQGEGSVPGSEKLGAPNLKKLIGDRLATKSLKPGDTGAPDAGQTADAQGEIPVATYLVLGVAAVAALVLLRARRKKQSTGKKARTEPVPHDKKAS